MSFRVYIKITAENMVCMLCVYHDVLLFKGCAWLTYDFIWAYVARGEWDGINTGRSLQILSLRVTIVQTRSCGALPWFKVGIWSGAGSGKLSRHRFYRIYNLNIYIFHYIADRLEKELRWTMLGIGCSRQKGVSPQPEHAQTKRNKYLYVKQLFRKWCSIEKITQKCAHHFTLPSASPHHAKEHYQVGKGLHAFAKTTK